MFNLVKLFRSGNKNAIVASDDNCNCSDYQNYHQRQKSLQQNVEPLKGMKCNNIPIARVKDGQYNDSACNNKLLLYKDPISKSNLDNKQKSSTWSIFTESFSLSFFEDQHKIHSVKVKNSDSNNFTKNEDSLKAHDYSKSSKSNNFTSGDANLGLQDPSATWGKIGKNANLKSQDPSATCGKIGKNANLKLQDPSATWGKIGKNANLKSQDLSATSVEIHDDAKSSKSNVFTSENAKLKTYQSQIQSFPVKKDSASLGNANVKHSESIWSKLFPSGGCSILLEEKKDFVPVIGGDMSEDE